MTWFDVGGFRSEWRNDFILFSEYGLRSEYYHPFTPLTHWFIAPRGLADNNPFYLYNDNKLVSIYRRTTLAGASMWAISSEGLANCASATKAGGNDFARQIGNRERAANLLRRLR